MKLPWFVRCPLFWVLTWAAIMNLSVFIVDLFGNRFASSLGSGLLVLVLTSLIRARFVPDIDSPDPAAA